MKSTLLLCLVSSLTLLQSCGPKKQTLNSTYKNKIVLGAFSDDISTPTLDESKLGDLPRMINLKSDMTAVKNQGSRGTCTFFSTMALVESSVKKDLKIDVNFSEEFLNYKAKTLGSYPRNEGSEVGSNLYTIQRSGVLLERDWSYQPTWFGLNLPCKNYKPTDRNAPAECFSHNSPDAETLKNVISSSPFTFKAIDKNTNDIITFLAKNQRPLTMSVAVNFNGWPNTGDVFYNEELRQECLATPSECGGHSILITGYDLDKKVFFFKNSWGNQWGHEGFGTITFDFVDNYVTDSLYYATTDKGLVIPKDHDKDSLEFLDFKLVSTQNDGANLKLATTGSVRGLKGHTIYVSSFLSTKSKSIMEAASDLNTQSIRINAADGVTDETYARAFTYFLPSNAGALDWTLEAPLVLNFPENILKSPTVSAVMANETEETLARTTIYVHTDDSTFKVLKRIYHPIK